MPEIRLVRPGRKSAGDTWLGLRANGEYRVTGVRQVPLLPTLLPLLGLGGLILTDLVSDRDERYREWAGSGQT